MSEIERAARLSVIRACGFAGLAIFGLMIGASPIPALSFKIGGVLTVVLSVILLIKAVRARSRPYQDTEVWLILNQEHRPAAPVAQRLIGGALERVYLTVAQHAAILASLLLVIALVLGLFQDQATAWAPAAPFAPVEAR